MAKSTLRSTAETSGAGRRALSAAARAAAKRAARADRPDSVPGPEAAASTEPVRTAEPDPERTAPPSDDADPAAEAAGSARGRRTSLLNAVLAALVVAGLVAAGLLAGAWRQDERTRQARTQAVAAARDAAPVILSYDYRHVDQDFAAATARLTGPFLEQYRKTTSSVVGPTARQYHAVVKATVAKPASGGDDSVSVVSASPDRVVVLLFVNQVTDSTRITGPRLDLNRVRLTLTRTSAGWKVTAVDAL